MPANRECSEGMQAPAGRSPVQLAMALGVKRIGLYSLWLPAALISLEMLGYLGVTPLEWLFIALAWPAAFPLTVSVLLLHRMSPFSAGLCAAFCAQSAFVPYIIYGVLGIALGGEYWLSTPAFWDVLVGIFRVFAEAAAASLPAWIVLGCTMWFRRWRRNRPPNHP